MITAMEHFSSHSLSFPQKGKKLKSSKRVSLMHFSQCRWLWMNVIDVPQISKVCYLFLKFARFSFGSGLFLINDGFQVSAWKNVQDEPRGEGKVGCKTRRRVRFLHFKLGGVCWKLQVSGKHDKYWHGFWVSKLI